MSVIHQCPGVVLISQSEQFGQGSEIAVHGKHAIGHDHGMAKVCALGRQDLAGVHQVVVTELAYLRPGELRTRMDAGMGQLVHQNQVTRAQQGGCDGQIGQIARAENDTVLAAFQCGQAALKFKQQVVPAGDQSGRTRAGTIFCGGLLGGADHFGIIGQAQIVVRAEIHIGLTIALDLHAGGIIGFLEPAAQLAFFQPGQLAGRETFKRWRN